MAQGWPVGYSVPTAQPSPSGHVGTGAPGFPTPMSQPDTAMWMQTNPFFGGTEYCGSVIVPDELMKKMPLAGRLVGKKGHFVKDWAQKTGTYVKILGSNPYFPEDSARFPGGPDSSAGLLRVVISSSSSAEAVQQCQALVIDHLRNLCWLKATVCDLSGSMIVANQGETASSGSDVPVETNTVEKVVETEEEKTETAVITNTIDPKLRARMATSRFALSVAQFAQSLVTIEVPDLQSLQLESPKLTKIHGAVKNAMEEVYKMVSIGYDLTQAVPKLHQPMGGARCASMFLDDLAAEGLKKKSELLNTSKTLDDLNGDGHGEADGSKLSGDEEPLEKRRR